MGILRDTVSGFAQSQSGGGSSFGGKGRGGMVSSLLQAGSQGLAGRVSQQSYSSDNSYSSSPYDPHSNQSRQDAGTYGRSQSDYDARSGYQPPPLDYPSSSGGYMSTPRPSYPRDGRMDYASTSTTYLGIPAIGYRSNSPIPPRQIAYQSTSQDEYLSSSSASFPNGLNENRPGNPTPPPLPPRKGEYREDAVNADRQRAIMSADPPSYESSYSAGPPQDFLPIALPQTGYGDGVPFVRGYSDELQQCGISMRDFMSFIDALNVSVMPNPEMQIVNKAAGLAGWFVPGAGGIVLSVLQIGAQIGGSVQLKSATATCLSNGNQTLFRPAGLEAVICNTQTLNNALGCSNNMPMQSYPSQFGDAVQQRLNGYQGYIVPLTTILPPPTSSGRGDLSARLGSGLSGRAQRKAMEKANKDMQEGKMKKATKMENSFQWLLIQPIASSMPAY